MKMSNSPRLSVWPWWEGSGNNDLTRFLLKRGRLFFSVAIGGFLSWIAPTMAGAGLTAENPHMLKDINALSIDRASVCGRFVEMDGVAYFCGADQQLWKTDGTSRGTQPMKFADGTIIRDGYGLVRAGKFIYFSRYDQLWRTDGTPRQTLPVKDGSGNILAYDYQDDELAVSGEYVYIATYSGLWKTKGTQADTIVIKTFDNYSDRPNDMEVVNGTLFYTTYDHQLWKSDGTAAGTVRVKDMPGNNYSSDHNNLTNVNRMLFFSMEDMGEQFDLWRSDGTTSGTVRIVDNVSDRYMAIGNFRAVNGMLFFTAETNGYQDTALWMSNGTTAGTKLITTIPDVSTSYSGYFLTTTVLGNALIFFARRDSGDELWTTDGTAVGTVRLAQDVSPELMMGTYNGKLYFSAANGTGLGHELWGTDGTVAGTALVSDIARGEHSSSPRWFGTFSRGILFDANTSERFRGSALWISQGTADTTKQVKDISQFTRHSWPSAPVLVEDEVFFLAKRGVTSPRPQGQWELWKTDGSEAGTRPVLNLIKGKTPGPGEPHFRGEYAGMANLDGTLYVSGRDPSGWGMWRTDGTAQGTKKLPHVLPDESKGIMTHLTVFDHKLYFFAATVRGMGLWQLGPDQATATLIKDGLTEPQPLNVVGDVLAFVNRENELWWSDGTPTGTRFIKALTLEGRTVIDQLQSFQHQILFRVQWAEDPDYGGFYRSALWSSDGTDAGTYPLMEVYPTNMIVMENILLFSQYGNLGLSDGTLDGTHLIANLDEVRSLTRVGSDVYFSANRNELWKSNGTTAGTVAVKQGLSIESWTMMAVNGAVYFSAYDTSPTGGELPETLSLRKSDGTASGTVVVKPGLSLRRPLNVEDHATFIATTVSDDEHSPAQIWQTDGTEAGTRRISNLADRGFTDYHNIAEWPVRVNNKLIFSIEGNQKGFEPWAFELP